MIKARTAKFQIGQIVRHRIFSFRGVIFDIDPEFNNTEEWWLSIPEDVRPHKDQPFYHLLAENSDSDTSPTYWAAKIAKCFQWLEKRSWKKWESQNTGAINRFLRITSSEAAMFALIIRWRRRFAGMIFHFFRLVQTIR